MDSLTMTEPTHGLVRIHGTVEQVAEMLTNAGYPKDASRLLAAQAKRERKGRLRLDGYAYLPEALDVMPD